MVLLKKINLLYLKKVFFTLKELKKTADHHYGKNIGSLPKFIYYSFFKINTFVVVGMDLNKELPKYPLDPEFKVIKPTIEELNKLREGKDLPREFYYDQIHGVKTCYIAIAGDEIAYIHWIYLKGDYNRFLKLKSEVAELNYNTTLPKFRGKRLQTKMLCHILEDLKKNGFRLAIGVVHSNNPPALKGAFRAGFVEKGKIKTFGPFNKKYSI